MSKYNREWYPDTKPNPYFDDFILPIHPRLKYNEEWMPQRATQYSAAFDVRYIADVAGKPLIIENQKTVKIPLGITLNIPPQLKAIIYARSSLYGKHGLMLANSVGLIDADYNGQELFAHFIVMNDEDGVCIEDGERIVQIEFQLSMQALVEMSRAYRLKPVYTQRDGGFGSTGSV